nr:hypothetical protein [uncultured Ligilactobacillus sp.]
MFKPIFQSSDSSFEKFINSLNYWQAINLRMTLLRSKRPNDSEEDIRIQAVTEYSDSEKLKYDLEEALNSPRI